MEPLPAAVAVAVAMVVCAMTATGKSTGVTRFRVFRFAARVAVVAALVASARIATERDRLKRSRRLGRQIPIEKIAVVDRIRPFFDLEIDELFFVVLNSLNSEEIKLVQLRLEGSSNRQIAEIFKVSIRTVQARLNSVEDHIDGLLRRQGSPSQTQSAKKSEIGNR